MNAALPESLIVDTANRLGAVSVPVVAIQSAWQSIPNCPGCLSSENGQRLFIAYRLRELGCFSIGCCEDNEKGTGCILHFFDIHHNTRNLTDEEYAAFMNGRRTEPDVAATKMWKLMDSEPVNALAGRTTYFSRSKKSKKEDAT